MPKNKEREPEKANRTEKFMQQRLRDSARKAAEFLSTLDPRQFTNKENEDGRS
jgi:hypothetical protein